MCLHDRVPSGAKRATNVPCRSRPVAYTAPSLPSATRLGPNIAAIVDSAVAFGLNNAGIHLQAAIKKNFGTAGAYGSRRLVNYVTGKRGGPRGRNIYRSAPPGEFPGIRTGLLKRSIRVTKATKSSLAVYVGTDVQYGRHLEYGTRNMPARPWLRRTFAEERNKMIDILRADAAKAITAQLGGK